MTYVMHHSAVYHPTKPTLHQKITYSYINGTAIQHMKFESCLAVWIQNANLVCERVSSGGDVRVEFSNLGSWSYVGNMCKGVTDTKKPTMRLGGIDPAGCYCASSPGAGFHFPQSHHLALLVLAIAARTDLHED